MSRLWRALRISVHRGWGLPVTASFVGIQFRGLYLGVFYNVARRWTR